MSEERLEDMGHKLLQDENSALTSWLHKSGYYWHLMDSRVEICFCVRD